MSRNASGILIDCLVEIGAYASALRARLAFSDFYDSEKCMRMNFTPFGTLWVPLRLVQIFHLRYAHR